MDDLRNQSTFLSEQRKAFQQEDLSHINKLVEDLHYFIKRYNYRVNRGDYDIADFLQEVIQDTEKFLSECIKQYVKDYQVEPPKIHSSKDRRSTKKA